MTVIVASESRKRAEWRAQAKVYTAAMHKALSRIEIAEDVSLLDAAETLVDAMPRDAQIAWRKVIMFERDHEDVHKWAPALVASLKPGATNVPEIIDAIFVFAMAIEARGDVAAEDAAYAALMALLLG